MLLHGVVPNEIPHQKMEDRANSPMIKANLLVDARKDINDQVVCEFWIYVLEFRKST